MDLQKKLDELKAKLAELEGSEPLRIATVDGEYIVMGDQRIHESEFDQWLVDNGFEWGSPVIVLDI